MQQVTDPVWSPFGPLAHPAQRGPARARTRWLWAVPIMAGILTVVGWTLSHDTAPGLALSKRSWITVAAAAVVAILLAAHHRRGGGRLALRVALEYAAVALLVFLVATASAAPSASPTNGKAHPTRAEAIASACPSVTKPVARATCLWQQTSKAANHTQPSQPAPKKGRHP
jgi:hypothetical protein